MEVGYLLPHGVYKIIVVKPLGKYTLWIRFSDMTEGNVDLSHLAGKGVFKIWEDGDTFNQVSIGSTGELVWKGGVDLCPDSLYCRLTGKSPESVFGLNQRAGAA